MSRILQKPSYARCACCFSMAAASLGALAGCGDSNLPPGVGAEPRPLPPPLVVGAHTDVPVAPGGAVLLKVSTTRKTFRRGETITFALSARDASRLPQALRFRSSQDFDLIATSVEASAARTRGVSARVGGQLPPVAGEARIGAGERAQSSPNEVWRWSAHKFFAADERVVPLVPGRTLQWTATWDQQGDHGETLPRGSYAVRATLATHSAVGSAPVIIDLTG